MFSWIRLLFSSIDFVELIKEGAIIVDVRTATEYENGHIPNSINIPLQNLSTKSDKMDTKRPIITCCSSGIRSASAKVILKSKGFKAYNGGS